MDNPEQYFVIKDMHDFTESTRIIVYNHFGKTMESKSNDTADVLDSLSPLELEELDQVLSYKESKAIIKSLVRMQKNKRTKQIRYIISDRILREILESLNARMTSNLLVSLCNKGLIESAYDEELDDFIFWRKEENENDQKPETD